MNLINQIIKAIPNWLKVILLASIAFGFWYFVIFKFDWRQLQDFWQSNWADILTSIGSIATAITVIITGYDLRERYKFEKNKFNFESDPTIKAYPFITDNLQSDYSIVEYDRDRKKVCRKLSAWHLISLNALKFKYENVGNGTAKNIIISVSNHPEFPLGNDTLIDETSELTKNETFGFSVQHLPQPQLQFVKWNQNFFIKLEYESMYNPNKTVKIYLAEVHSIRVEEVISGKESTEYYIHNINSIKI